MSDPTPETTALLAQLAARDGELALLRTQVAALEQLVLLLKDKLRTDSRTSSKPPSSDGPGAAPRSRPPTGKPRGGQKGHKGSSRRQRLPPELVLELCASHCKRCARALAGLDPSPQVHQVVDLDDRGRTVTDYSLHKLRCAGCGAHTRAALPVGVSWSPFGPRLRAWMAALPPRFRLGRREVVALALETFGVAVSLGSVSTHEQKVSDAVLPAVLEVRAAVEASAVVHADETPCRSEGKKGWLWVACTLHVASFVLASTRGRVVLATLLGAFKGVLVTDRYSAYQHWPEAEHQACWSHVLRFFQWLAESPERSVAELGKDLLESSREMLHAWNEVQRGTRARADFDAELPRWQAWLMTPLLYGLNEKSEKVRSGCLGLQQDFAQLFTFTQRAGVEPTNNRAERRIRAGVRWRKNSLGTQSERGSRFVERLLTVSETLRMQGRGVLAWLAQLLQAKQGVPGIAAPSLLTAHEAG